MSFKFSHTTKTYFLIYIYVSLPIITDLLLKDTSFSLLHFLCVSAGLMFPFAVFPYFLSLLTAFYLIIYIIYGLNLYHFILFKSPLTQSATTLILDSNIIEAQGFLYHFITFPSALALCFYLFTGIILCWYICQNKKHISTNLFIILLSESFFILSVYQGFHIVYPNSNSLLPYKIANWITKYDAEKKELTSNLKKYKSVVISGLKSETPEEQKETYIIVIGESATRNRLKYYRYERNTTPYSTQPIKPFIFANVRSPHAITVLSLKKTLSLYQNDTYKGSLIDIFRLSGFKSFWISNQYFGGEESDLTNIYAYSTDSITFTNDIKNYLYDMKKPSYDEKLLPHLDNALKDKHSKKIIFMHLAGSHFPYHLRFPQNFNFYKAQNVSSFQKEFNDYDNSIRYTDFILSEIVKKVSTLKEQSFVLYFSDHGEDILLNPNSCHCHTDNPTTQTASMYEIPFLLWFNDAYKKLNKALISKLPNYTNRHFINHNLIHSLPTLAGLSFDLQENSKNLFCDEYIPEQP